MNTISLCTLPNEMILLVLERVPVQDLLTNVTLSNVRLYRLVSHACTQRRSLSLILGIDSARFSTFTAHHISSPNSFQYWSFNSSGKELRNQTRPGTYCKYACLRIAEARLSMHQNVVELFPNIQKLQLAAYTEHFINTNPEVCKEMPSLVAALLESWSDQLHSLHLATSFVVYHPKLRNWYKRIPECGASLAGLYDKLFAVINGMASLRCLALCIDNRTHLPMLDLPVLRQLEMFYFFINSSKESDLIVHSLRHYGPDVRNLGAVGLGCVMGYLSELGDILQTSAQDLQLTLPLIHMSFYWAFTDLPAQVVEPDIYYDLATIEQQMNRLRARMAPYAQSLCSLRVLVFYLRGSLGLEEELVRFVRHLSELITPDSGIAYLHLTLNTYDKLQLSVASDNLNAVDLPSLPSIRDLHLELISENLKLHHSSMSEGEVDEVYNKLLIGQIFPNLTYLRISNRCPF